MKRPAPKARSGGSYQDIKKDFTAGQLAGIGAVAMAFNEAEFLLDCQIYSGLNLSGGIWTEVTSRINGIDGKMAIVKAAVEDDRFPKPIRDAIAETLGNFGPGSPRGARNRRNPLYFPC